MKRVAFYLDNSAIRATDCSNALEGNPGIGGTEWLFVAVSSLLANRDNDIETVLYTTASGTFPVGIENVIVNNLTEAIALADSSGFDYLVVKHLADNITNSRFDVKTKHLQIICWCHIFVCHWELDYYANNDLISKVVFVGREMYDLYRDHKIYNKATYIYNCVPSGDARELVRQAPYHKRKNVVVYVGSLVPFKGFHLLAQAWPQIIEEVQDAEMYVIGSGKLYDETFQLGEWGIAEASYEKSFMSFLTQSGKIISSVHFMGVMGEDKKEILLKSKVGVPNPSGITETFCLSAVEMQMYGCRIATINFPGYMDTVRNGRLYNRKGNLATVIVELLQSSENYYASSMDYFEENFSYETVITKWEELIKTGNICYADKLTNLCYRFKWLKELLRIIKRHLPFLYYMPMVERILIFIERRVYGKATYIDSNISIG